jgi:hypothetical protein
MSRQAEDRKPAQLLPAVPIMSRAYAIAVARFHLSEAQSPGMRAYWGLILDDQERKVA